MSKSNWAPIVYGRTHSVDFRLLAVPHDFKPDEIDWALNHISVTTRSADELSGHPRWSLFKNEHHCVFGLTCMARELITQGIDEKLGDITKDSKGRPLYIFVGYVAQIDQEERLTDIPSYSLLDLSLFQSLYEYVAKKWLEKTYDLSRNIAIQTKYKSEVRFDSEDSSIIDIVRTSDPILADIGSTKANLFPDSVNERKQLWKLASSRDKNFNLCLGLASRRDIVDGPFVNGTALDVVSILEIDKPKQDLQKDAEVAEEQKYKEIEGEQIEEDPDNQFKDSDRVISDDLNTKFEIKSEDIISKGIDNIFKGVQSFVELLSDNLPIALSNISRRDREIKTLNQRDQKHLPSDQDLQDRQSYGLKPVEKKSDDNVDEENIVQSSDALLEQKKGQEEKEWF